MKIDNETKALVICEFADIMLGCEMWDADTKEFYPHALSTLTIMLRGGYKDKEEVRDNVIFYVMYNLNKLSDREEEYICDVFEENLPIHFSESERNQMMIEIQILIETIESISKQDNLNINLTMDDFNEFLTRTTSFEIDAPPMFLNC